MIFQFMVSNDVFYEFNGPPECFFILRVRKRTLLCLDGISFKGMDAPLIIEDREVTGLTGHLVTLVESSSRWYIVHPFSLCISPILVS